MDVIFVRHAIAEDRDVFARTGAADELRPLTPPGREKMQRAAAGLRSLVPQIDLLATSPLVRAVETAQIVAQAYDGLEPVEVPELAPEADPQDLLRWLENLEGEYTTVVLVGHEPSLSEHVSFLTARSDEAFVEFKKGGACLLSFYDEVDSGGATLRWMLTPAILRGLGG